MGIMEKIFGDLNAKEIKKIEKIVDKVEAYDEAMQALSDVELRAKTDEFRGRLQEGETLDDILPEAFAVCREAAFRTLGMKHFRVQLIGGVALHQGRIAEMKTGEGKTLVASLPAYLNALEGKGVHVVTVNDYLAKRDCETIGKCYMFLGLSVGCVIHGISDAERKAAYRADITYGTNNEYGFDYLRDNMVNYREDMTQRELNFAIVDEVDSILIDEARTPLIISGRGDESSELYKEADRFIRTLNEEQDYNFEEKDKQVMLTEDGIAKCEAYFDIENMADPDNMAINHHVMQSLKAHVIMKKNIDYIVKDEEVVIVDEFTGRLMFGRRYSDGLHQAIECKEGLKVKAESKTLATITLQNYFRMYNKLSGMTGTAKTEEDEFRDIYNMDVVVIPTNKPVIRKDGQDAVFATQKGKYKAIAEAVIRAHEKGQPVLVGTISIESSELIADMLRKRGVRNLNVLNAKNHEKEAEIVAEAGREGAVTIATNMAGRGTDIILGGNPEFEAKRELLKLGYPLDVVNFAASLVPTDEEELLKAREEYKKTFAHFQRERALEQERVIAAGGLFIIGTERHESRRIDNQLRGRAGRQGDPGETVFCIAMEDELLRLFGGERMMGIVKKMGIEEDEAIESKMITRSIENAQKKVEGKNFGIRKYVLQYDNVMNKQREIIYGERKRVLFGENLEEYISNMTAELIENIVMPFTVDSKFAEEWDLEHMERNLKTISNEFSMPQFSQDDMLDLSYDSLVELIKTKFNEIYKEREALIGSDRMRELERVILLRVVDGKWMDHIDAMDQLKSGIGLRGIGQQDPAAAYAREGFDMFEEMISSIKEDTVRYCYNVTVETNAERKEVAVEMQEKKEDVSEVEREMLGGGYEDEEIYTNQPQEKQKPFVNEEEKVGRNDPCPCGSGRKYKHCHGKDK